MLKYKIRPLRDNIDLRLKLRGRPGCAVVREACLSVTINFTLRSLVLSACLVVASLPLAAQTGSRTALPSSRRPQLPRRRLTPSGSIEAGG